MKFQVTFKDPDVLDDAIREAIRADLPAGLDKAERAALVETRHEKIRAASSSWFKYGECDHRGRHDSENCNRGAP